MLRGGLRRRVTINDCEIRIQGGRVSVQWGKKMSIRQQEGKRGDERGIPWRDFREKWNAWWKGWGYGREHSVIFYWCRETGRCKGRSGTEDRGDLRRGKKAKMEWGKAWRLVGNKRRNTDDVKWHFLGERKEWTIGGCVKEWHKSSKVVSKSCQRRQWRMARKEDTG